MTRSLSKERHNYLSTMLNAVSWEITLTKYSQSFEPCKAVEVEYEVFNVDCSHCLLPEIQTDVLLDKPSLAAENLSLASSFAPCHTSWYPSLQKPLYQISTCSTFKREINSLFLSPSMKESQQHVGNRQRIEVEFSLKAGKVKISESGVLRIRSDLVLLKSKVLLSRDVWLGSTLIRLWSHIL